jgi:hypothetical protein
MPQVDAESLLEQLHKYQSAQGNSEDITELQLQITQLQVCRSWAKFEYIYSASCTEYGRPVWLRLHLLVQ